MLGKGHRRLLRRGELEQKEVVLETNTLIRRRIFQAE